MQSLANIAALAQLSASLVFLLLGSAHFAEAELDVRRELQCGTMERASLLFG